MQALRLDDVSTWEERMAQRAHERRRLRGELDWSRPADRPLLQAQATAQTERIQREWRDAHPERCSPVPPDDGTCRECCEWKPEMGWPGVYVWVQTCGGCDHAHHDDEVWLAAV